MNVNNPHPESENSFQPDPELENKLRLLLAHDPNPERAARLYLATVDSLNHHALQTMLQHTLGLHTINLPTSLKPAVETAITDELQIQSITNQLTDELHVPPPQGLNARVFNATIQAQQQTAIENQTLEALAAPAAPQGLAKRIFDNTVDQLPNSSTDVTQSTHDTDQSTAPAVIGRVGRFSQMTFLMRAACIMFGISVGSWLIIHAIQQNPDGNIILDDTALETLYETIDPTAQSDNIDIELQYDIDQMDQTLDQLNETGIGIGTDIPEQDANANEDLYDLLNDLNDLP